MGLDEMKHFAKIWWRPLHHYSYSVSKLESNGGWSGIDGADGVGKVFLNLKNQNNLAQVKGSYCKSDLNC